MVDHFYKLACPAVEIRVVLLNFHFLAACVALCSADPEKLTDQLNMFGNSLFHTPGFCLHSRIWEILFGKLEEMVKDLKITARKYNSID